jgi:hypothetical protein
MEQAAIARYVASIGHARFARQSSRKVAQKRQPLSPEVGFSVVSLFLKERARLRQKFRAAARSVYLATKYFPKIAEEVDFFMVILTERGCH